ncbi:conserved hypothetical protein [Phenylobacterium zucineum HLK1]|uniref:Sugar transporter n=1 Tax=Phenylobacterium zucineum (strain HLK1) TaxID=450851 RepID=B4R8Q0_PHEZH|nr:hypothetical protein [Phenylobacterium zucineum]ACG77677.1 conserved hypothetical protein [Phenylobacterium zucineum HLK1]
MTTTTMETSARTPWHLWVVGIVALLWNGFAGYDYVMTNLQGEAYMRQMGMTEPQIAHFNAMPTWMMAVWAIGVWGGVLGALLLLLRRKWALHAFVASLAAFIVSLVYTYGMTNGAEVMGQTVMIMQGVILVSCLFFAWYAWRVTKQGLLR